MNSKDAWNSQELFSPPEIRSAEKFPQFVLPGLQSLLLQGQAVAGRSTWAYAYYSLPDGAAPAGGWPAVVLFHGGGGTAFAKYIQLWNRWGYAAIAFDHYGKLPETDKLQAERAALPESWLAAEGLDTLPQSWLQGWNQQASQECGKWVRHAVSLCLKAHSFLRLQTQINPDKIGMIGVSWGGVLGAIAAALDPRLKFAVLNYGCGFHDLAGPELSFHKYAREWWEPKHFLPQCQVPLLWINGTNDQNFAPGPWSRSVAAAPSSAAAALVPALDHSHGAFAYPWVKRFADSFCFGGTAVPKLGASSLSGEVISTPILRPGRGILRAELEYTLDSGPTPQRRWQAVPAKFDRERVQAVIPSGTVACYLNAYDDTQQDGWNWPASSDYITRDPSGY